MQNLLPLLFQGGHLLKFSVSFPLDNYYYNRFFRKVNTFSKFFLKIFFRRISSNYFLEKKTVDFSTAFLFYFFPKKQNGLEMYKNPITKFTTGISDHVIRVRLQEAFERFLALSFRLSSTSSQFLFATWRKLRIPSQQTTIPIMQRIITIFILVLLPFF